MADLMNTSIRGNLNVSGALTITNKDEFLIARKTRTVNNVDYTITMGAGWGDNNVASAALEVWDTEGTMLGRLDVCGGSGKIKNGKTNQYLLEEHQSVLWSGAMFMNANQTATLSENVSAQNNGIVLVWSAYSSGAKDWNWNFTFVPKQWVSSNGGAGVTSHMSGSNFSDMASKYVYVSNNKVTGNAANENTGTANGITYANNKFVLRYVIGV